MRSRTAGTDRGVSEVVGFILVFSLVVGTISLVYVGGFSGLESARDAERVNNAERAFDVMANNFQQMARGDAPNRATEIKLADAQLTTSDQRLVKVNASATNDTVVEAESVVIRYDAPGDSRIVYENGAVIRVDDGNAVMKREPDFVFSDENGRTAVVVRQIELRGAGQGIGGTSSTVLVRAERKSTFVNDSAATDDVEIVIHTHEDRAEAWVEYYEREIESVGGGGDACERRGTPTNGGPETERVVCGPFDVDDLGGAKITVDVTLT